MRRKEGRIIGLAGPCLDASSHLYKRPCPFVTLLSNSMKNLYEDTSFTTLVLLRIFWWKVSRVPDSSKERDFSAF